MVFDTLFWGSPSVGIGAEGNSSLYISGRINDVNITVEGDRPVVIAVVGESGSGKTTLAKTLLRLETRPPATPSSMTAS